MTEPVKKKVKVLRAEYVPDIDSIVIAGECENGRLRHQMNRSCFSFGDRTEDEIVAELHATAELMVGKSIWMVFDTELNDKIKDRAKLKY